MTTTSSFGELRKGVFPTMQKRTFADRTTQPFWDAAREDRLVVPRCTNCGTFRLPPYPLCYVCQSFDVDWVELSGLGTVYSYTVVHHPLHPDLSAVVPYVSGIVELDGTQGEGARMLANIVDCEPEEISIGSRVRIVFEHVNDDMSTPRFQLVPGQRRGVIMEEKIWANSGDSHLVEPHNLFRDNLPPELAERMPRGVLDEDGQFETIYVDGLEFRRKVPFSKRPMVDPETGLSVFDRAPGANDMRLRLKDLNQEGVWAELIYTSIGMWMHSIRDPQLMLGGCQVINDWAIEYQRFSPRYVCTAMIPTLSVETALAEVERTADMGFKIAMLPTSPTLDGPNWQRDDWHPLWALLAETGMHVGFHAGSDPHEADTFNGTYHRGPGGHLMNYYEASYHMQLAAAKLVASGVFERHPTLKCIVSEGGATWVPFMADRLDEAYRQHVNQVWPKFKRLPSEYLFENVYASFQHDRSAPQALAAMGYRNVCWGSDYPHIEGTFGHTQKTLHELVADLTPEQRERITKGAFQDLFPHVPPAPEDGTEFLEDA